MIVWVDADACPVKSEIERIAGKRGVEVVHACAHASMKREAPGVRVELIAGGPDAVDEWILERCAPGDMVVTQDIPMAALAVKKGALVVEFRGKELHPDNIHERSSLRDLSTSIRESGGQTRQPRPLTAADRKAFAGSFAQALDKLLARARK